jgi:hypothetical protein
VPVLRGEGPKRHMTKRLSNDPNVRAFQIVQMASGQIPSEPLKNPAAVALSKLGAAKGGAARAASLTAKQRSAIARKAAKSRWAK